jgi:hypothetical protein
MTLCLSLLGGRDLTEESLVYLLLNPAKQSKQARQTSKANKQSKQESKQTNKLAWVTTIIA